MSTILLYTSPARGHLYPMMDVALALRAAGHRVVVQTLASEADRVRVAEMEHRPIAAEIEALALEDYRGGNPLQSLRSTMATWLERAPHELEDLHHSCEAVAPDLLVVDANSWGAAAFAESRFDRWAMFLPYVLPTADPLVPAFGPGFPPPAGPLGRFRDQVLRTITAAATRDLLARHNGLRAQAGASPLPSFDDLFSRADRLLYRTAEPFDYPRARPPENLVPLGPGLWAPPGEAPEWLADLPGPRVLVSVSTELQEDGAIIEAALEGLADEPGSVIVTTAALDPARFTAPHERVRIQRFLPHAAVIPEVDVVLTHGGMGSTQRALAAGKPVVVVPWGRDQSETARRVEHCGAGVRLPRHRLTASRVRDAVRAALDCAPAAGRVAEAFAEAGGAERGVRELESLLDSRSRAEVA